VNLLEICYLLFHLLLFIYLFVILLFYFVYLVEFISPFDEVFGL